MKKIRWNKKITIPLALVCVVTFLLIVSLVFTAVFAQTVLFSIPSTITIVLGPTEAAAYYDAECTTPIPQVVWGEVEHGQHIQLDFYIRNEGVEPIMGCYLEILEDVSDIMTYTFTPTSIDLPNVGDVGLITFEADILITAPLETRSIHYQGDMP